VSVWVCREMFPFEDSETVRVWAAMGRTRTVVKISPDIRARAPSFNIDVAGGEVTCDIVWRSEMAC
jgi:hypothetical protein